MRKFEEMKKDNKGFSLVELIIVVAIMAVLMMVVAPQFLRYVERTRLQTDNSAIGEIANAAKIAAANEKVAQEIADATGSKITLSIPVSSAGPVTATGATELIKEITATMGDALQMKSNTYKKAGTAPTLEVEINSDSVVTVTGKNIITEVGGTAADLKY